MEIKNFVQCSWDVIKQSTINEVWGNHYSFEDLVRKLESKFADLSWKHLTEWEDLEDGEILRYLSKLRNFNSDILIITDISYKSQYGPFRVKAKDILSFSDMFWTNFGECMFNGDTIIFSESEKVIWLFHHEGLYTSLKI